MARTLGSEEADQVTMYILYSYTVHIHYAHTLCTYTVLVHYAHTPCTYTMHIHYAHTQCTYTVLIHYAHTLYSHTMHRSPKQAGVYSLAGRGPLT
jgi:hypothetical protein